MIKIIACKIFETYIRNNLPENSDITYLEVQLHNTPKKLSRLIQQEIDKSQDCEKILLLYGLCGNMLLDIEVRNVPVYVIRVHDCLSILLGGHQKYLEMFENRKSSSWTCRGLLENKVTNNNKDYDQWVIDYGEEEADYLRSILCTPCNIYVKMENEDNHPDYKENILGNIDYLNNILLLKNRDLLQLNKNEKLKLTIDHNVIEKYGIE